MAKYTLTDLNGETIAQYARKDAALKAAERESLVAYRVLSPSGAVVAEVVPDGYPAADDDSINETLDAMEDALTDEEDLIGETPADAEPEPETAEEQAEDEDLQVDAPGTKQDTRTFDIADMKRKIAALLAKAERTDNENERDAFTAKAETLMVRLGIQAAELEAAGEVKPEEIVEVNHVWGGIYATTMVGFTSDLANGFGNLTVLQSSRGQRRRVVFVIGHKSDVEQFMTLLHSLNLQALSALKRFQRENAEDRAFKTVQEKFVQDRSFLTGFSNEVRRRLAALRIETEAEATTGAALVLASKQQRVNAYMEEAYPKLGKARGGNQQFSSKGAMAGRTAGASANIGGKGVSGGAKGALKG